jgi:hypothetical protein
MFEYNKEMMQYADCRLPVILHEAAHFVTHIAYCMELGITPQIKLLALNHPEYPDQPGIVVSEPMINLDQIPSRQDIIDDTGNINDAHTARLQIRMFLAGHAAEYVYIRSRNVLFDTGAFIDSIIDPNEGAGDTCNAVISINALNGGNPKRKYAEMHQECKAELVYHFMDVVWDVRQLYDEISWVAMQLSDAEIIEDAEMGILINAVQLRLESKDGIWT